MAYTTANKHGKVYYFWPGFRIAQWKQAIRDTDTSVFFANQGSPGQRGLNENSNGLLRRDGLTKRKDFTGLSQAFISSVTHYRNSIPRKSLNYKTPIQVLTEYLTHMTNLN